MKDLPIEVIKAIKELSGYLTEAGYSDIQVSYLGTTKWFKSNNDTPIVISPIALDMMLMRQQGPGGQDD